LNTLNHGFLLMGFAGRNPVYGFGDHVIKQCGIDILSWPIQIAHDISEKYIHQRKINACRTIYASS